VLQAQAGTRLIIDERGIPTGDRAAVPGTEYDFVAPRPIGATQLNTAFGDLGRDDHGRATVRLRAPDGCSVDLWLDDHHPYLSSTPATRCRTRNGGGARSPSSR
jgi:aldose 1-epimerase